MYCIYACFFSPSRSTNECLNITDGQTDVNHLRLLQFVPQNPLLQPKVHVLRVFSQTPDLQLGEHATKKKQIYNKIQSVSKNEILRKNKKC